MLNKLILLIITGMPGLQKVVLFYIIEAIFGGILLGQFSNDFYIVQMCIIFAAMGLTGVIMIKIPKLQGENLKEQLSAIINTFFIFSLFFIPILLILKLNGYLFGAYEAFILLLGMSGNMILRYYYLSIKKYTTILIYDIILTVLIISNLMINDIEFSLILEIGLSYSFIFVLFIIFEKIPLSKHLIALDDVKTSLNISFINFLSGGVYLVLVPIISVKLGVEYAGLIGIIFTTVSVILLFPRALSSYYLPELSKHVHNEIEAKKIYKKFSLLNILVLFVLFIFSSIIYFLLSNYILQDLFSLENSAMLYFTFLVSFLVSQFSLVPSNMLLAMEKTFIQTKVGIQLVSIYFIFYICLEYFSIEKYNFVFLFISMIVLGNIYRYVIFRNYVNSIV